MVGRSVSSAPLALCVSEGACCSSSIWALREGLVTKEVEKPPRDGEALCCRCKPLEAERLQSSSLATENQPDKHQGGKVSA